MGVNTAGSSRAPRSVGVQDARRVPAQEHGRAAAYVRDADLFRDHAGGWLAIVLNAALPAPRPTIALIRH
jgi:hypothetical protein